MRAAHAAKPPEFSSMLPCACIEHSRQMRACTALRSVQVRGQARWCFASAPLACAHTTQHAPSWLEPICRTRYRAVPCRIPAGACARAADGVRRPACRARGVHRLPRQQDHVGPDRGEGGAAGGHSRCLGRRNCLQPPATLPIVSRCSTDICCRFRIEAPSSCEKPLPCHCTGKTPCCLIGPRACLPRRYPAPHRYPAAPPGNSL